MCEESHPGALFLKLVTPPPVSHVVPSVEALYKRYKTLPSQYASFQDFIAVETTEEDHETLRNLHQSQPAWLEARKGRITASLAESVRTLKNVNNPGKILINRILGKCDVITSKSMTFGKDNEHVARHLYSVKEGPKHKNFEIEECGLHLLKEAPYIGASPDGLATCSCHDKKLLEIKCSFKHQQITPEEIPKIDSAYHLEVVDLKLHLKTTSAWYSQIQFQMGVTGVSKCDLVIYTKKGIAIIPISFDEERWQLLLKKAKQVFDIAIIPLL